jgi:protein-S-isoprenylcysteine O-methyltransferase Ste14
MTTSAPPDRSSTQRAISLLEFLSTRTSYIAIAVTICGGAVVWSGSALAISPGLKALLFAILALAALCFALGLAVNLRVPAIGLWPPPAAGSWQFWFVWVSYTVSGVGVAVIGVLDWGTLGLDHWLFLAIGVAGLLFAVPFNEWGMRALSDHQTLGLQGELITNGPYRYSRNPQYVAEIVTFLSVVLITNSLLAAVICALVVLWFLLAPLAEEPWLARQFGERFDDYRRRVPRFLGPVKRR